MSQNWEDLPIDEKILLLSPEKRIQFESGIDLLLQQEFEETIDQ
jgi:hypothetical protein